ncbi:MAG: hypothetical protein WBQ73_03960 [Candidatus Babeliales bacterium]
MVRSTFFPTCFVVLAVALSHFCMHADIHDNRFFPLINPHPLTYEPDTPSYLVAQGAFSWADRSYNMFGQEVQLPAIFGSYDLKDIVNAYVALGNQNPLPASLQDVEIPFVVTGSMQAQGCSLLYHQTISPQWSCGLALYFLRLDQTYRFILTKKDIFTEAQEADIDEQRRLLYQRLGFYSGDHAHITGIGDIDLYVRFTHSCPYFLRCTRTQHMFQLGALIPTGKEQSPFVAPSLPFGGNGHPGIYCAIKHYFELKEDLLIGVEAQCSKRFEQTDCLRVGTCNIPPLYGVTTQQMTVDPGVTAHFSPFIILSNVRQGLGLHLRYTVKVHDKDTFSTTSSLPFIVNTAAHRQLSEWTAEYVTLGFFYDFSKVKPVRSFEPTFYLTWDIPSSAIFKPKRVYKTYTLSLGCEFVF